MTSGKRKLTAVITGITVIVSYNADTKPWTWVKIIGPKTLHRGDHNMIQIHTFNSKILPILPPPQDTSIVVNITRYCTNIWLIGGIVWIRSHEFLSLKEQGFLSNWVDDTCLTNEQLINGLIYRGKRWLGKMVAGYLNLRPYLDCLFEASKCTQCSDSLAGDSLKFGEFSATTAAIFQNAFCIFPQLWNVHQRTRQNLSVRSSPCSGR